MKNCTACGQPLPKRVPQPRDIVQIEGITDPPRLGVVLDSVGAALYDERFGPPMAGYTRVLAVSGPLTGLVTQYATDRLTVVKGAFRVTERL